MPTYYVDPVNGLDTNDGLSVATAFKTSGKAATVAVDEDTVKLLATATETLPTGGLTFPSTTYGIHWIGLNSSGVDDGTRYTYTGTASETLFWLNGAHNFTNIRITGDGTQTAIQHLTTGTCSYWNCEFDNLYRVWQQYNGGHVSGYVYGSSVHDIANRVAYCAANRYGPVFYHSTLKDCAAMYYGSPSRMGFYSCVVKNVADLGTSSYYGSCWTRNSVFDNCGPIGIGDRDTANVTIEVTNNVFMNAPGNIIEWTADNKSSAWVFNNLLYNVTGVLCLNPSPSTMVQGTLTGNPLFVDAANGDYTPQAGSPLIGAGLGGVTIGKLGASGGGGGSSGWSPFDPSRMFGGTP